MAINRSLRREFLGTLIETSRHLRHFVDRRAQRLGLTGAQLRLLSKVSAGTEVELCVPSRIAFGPRQAWAAS